MRWLSVVSSLLEQASDIELANLVDKTIPSITIPCPPVGAGDGEVITESNGGAVCFHPEWEELSGTNGPLPEDRTGQGEEDALWAAGQEDWAREWVTQVVCVCMGAWWSLAIVNECVDRDYNIIFKA